MSHNPFDLSTYKSQLGPEPPKRTTQYVQKYPSTLHKPTAHKNAPVCIPNDQAGRDKGEKIRRGGI